MAPTGAGKPAAEMVMPTVCATVPVKAVGITDSSCAVKSGIFSSRRCGGSVNSSSIRANWDSSC